MKNLIPIIFLLSALSVLSAESPVKLDHVHSINGFDGFGPVIWRFETADKDTIQKIQDYLISVNLKPREDDKILDHLLRDPDSIRLPTKKIIRLYDSNQKMIGLITDASFFDLKNRVCWRAEDDSSLASGIQKEILAILKK